MYVVGSGEAWTLGVIVPYDRKPTYPDSLRAMVAAHMRLEWRRRPS